MNDPIREALTPFAVITEDDFKGSMFEGNPDDAAVLHFHASGKEITMGDFRRARAALAAPAVQAASTVQDPLMVAAPQAGEDAREAKQRILDAAQWWADQRDVGPHPAKEAWTALAMRIDAELAMLTEGRAPQPAAQAAPAVPDYKPEHIRNYAKAVRVQAEETHHGTLYSAAHCLMDFADYLDALTTQGARRT